MVLGHTGAVLSKAPRQVLQMVISPTCYVVFNLRSQALMTTDNNYMFNDKVAYTNVREQPRRKFLTGSSIVKEMFENGQIGIIGGVYIYRKRTGGFFKNLTRKNKKSKKLEAWTIMPNSNY